MIKITHFHVKLNDLQAWSIKLLLINEYIPTNANVIERINWILFMCDKWPPPDHLVAMASTNITFPLLPLFIFPSFSQLHIQVSQYLIHKCSNSSSVFAVILTF